MLDRRLLPGLVASAAITIALFWLTPLPLGVPGEWTWIRIPIGDGQAIDAVLGWIMALVPAAVFLAVAAVGAKWIPKIGPLARGGWLAGLTLAGFFWTSLVQESPVYEYRTQKHAWVLYYPGSSGYYHKARYEMDGVRPFLAEYEALMAEGDVLHVGTHPPGLFLLSRAFLQLCQHSPALVGILQATTPGPMRDALDVLEENTRGTPRHVTEIDRAALWLGALFTQWLGVATVIPLYLLARRHASPLASWRAAAFWPAVPALAIFLPVADAMYPFIATLFLWLWLEGWGREQWWMGAAAGFVLWLGLFQTLAFLPVAVLAALLTGWEIFVSPNAATSRTLAIRQHLPRARLLLIAAAAAGFLLPVALLWGAFDHNLLSVWAWNYRNHAGFYAEYPRTFWKWLLVNPVELAFGVGLPVIILAVAAGRRVWQRDGWRSPRFAPFVGCVGVWGLLWLSGKNMGEAMRLWLFLMPWPVWLTAPLLEINSADRVDNSSRLWLIALGLQLLVSLATVTRVFGFHYVQ